MKYEAHILLPSFVKQTNSCIQFLTQAIPSEGLVKAQNDMWKHFHKIWSFEAAPNKAVREAMIHFGVELPKTYLKLLESKYEPCDGIIEIDWCGERVAVQEVHDILRYRKVA